MPGTIVMRIHRVRTEVVVAACDSELIGRELPVGQNGYKVKISSDFYGEQTVGAEELVWALKRATIVNLLGARVVQLAETEGFVAPGGTGTLGGVPHAEIITLPE
ncbi:MAG: DUF424 family protein [Thermoplasmata archaeon]